MAIGKSMSVNVAKLLNDHLDKFYKENPFVFLVSGSNSSDGIGDFIHIYDFFKYYKNQFSDDHRIKVKGMCQLWDDKLKIIKNIYGQDFFEETKEQNFDRFWKMKSGTFGKYEINDEEKFHAEKDFVMHSYPEKYINYGIMPPFGIDSEAIINVSVPICFGWSSPSTGDLLARSKDGTYIHSILEYGKYNKDIKVHEKNVPQQSMGVLNDQVGIKFDPLLVNASNLTNEEKILLLNTIDNKKIITVLQNDLYNSNAFLCCGYIQSESSSHDFAKLSATLSNEHQNIYLFINKNHFHDGDKLKIDEKFVNYLKKINIGQIELIDNEGNILNKIIIDDCSEKMLRLVDFSGISENDKKILLSLSECVAASGDNSISEMIATKKFPFLAVPSWKKMFVNQIIEDIQNRFPQYNELICYLKMQGVLFKRLDCMEIEAGPVDIFSPNRDEKNNKLDALYKHRKKVPFFLEHHDAILQQWQMYCDYLIAYKNVEKALDRIADHAVIKSILNKGEKDELETLCFLHETILLSTLEGDDSALLKDILNILPIDTSLTCWNALLKKCIDMNAGNCFDVLASSKFFVAHLNTTAHIMSDILFEGFSKKLSPKAISFVESIGQESKVTDLVLTTCQDYYNKFIKQQHEQEAQILSSHESDKNFHLLCKISVITMFAIRINDSAILFQSPEWLLLQDINDENLRLIVPEIEKTIFVHFTKLNEHSLPPVIVEEKITVIEDKQDTILATDSALIDRIISTQSVDLPIKADDIISKTIIKDSQPTYQLTFFAPPKKMNLNINLMTKSKYIDFSYHYTINGVTIPGHAEIKREERLVDNIKLNLFHLLNSIVEKFGTDNIDIASTIRSDNCTRCSHSQSLNNFKENVINNVANEFAGKEQSAFCVLQ